jgi:hypothetical protein
LRFLLLSFLFQSFMVTGALGAATYAAAEHQTVQICTTSGIAWIDVSSNSSSHSSKATPGGHCQFCGAVATALESHPVLFQTHSSFDFVVSIPFSTAVVLSPPSFQHPPAQAPPVLI